MPPTVPTVTTVWELWSYDVWGNARVGWDVNDRSCFDRAYSIACEVQRCNVGTPYEFKYATPSDAQIKRAFGLGSGSCIETVGDDVSIFVTRAHDGYPLGEMKCTSHRSLSPIIAPGAEARS